MTLRYATVYLLSTLIVAGPLQAEESPAPTQAAPAAAEEPDVICKNEAQTGSRLKKRVCTTRAQREAAEHAAAANKQSLNPRTISSNPAPAG
ncbi:MAG: hypothetical protein HC809_04480 [Gammaproteobacteria bacterium]|nr:hypothetical protein [Gammaproteobacteria bacterium]